MQSAWHGKKTGNFNDENPSGIDDLVLKPFSERDLIDKIATYLKKN